MGQFITLVCAVGFGCFIWSITGNVLLTVGAVIFGGFVGSLISFQIHQSRRMKMMGFTSRKELKEFDKDLRELQEFIRPELQKDLKTLNRTAQMEGYSSYQEKAAEAAYKRWLQVLGDDTQKS